MPRKSRKPRTNSCRPAADDPATRFACDVLDGKFTAGDLVKGSCRRHLKDLDSGAARGLEFRADQATRICRFFPALLSVTEGAAAGQPFHLLRWHEFVAGSLFGWYGLGGTRRFRRAWLETGKGQAKSPFMAGVGLYMMGFDGKDRAEAYAVATDRNQANVLFRDAASMVRAPLPGHEEGDSLEARGEVVIRGNLDNAYKIEHPATGSKFEAKATVESLSGPRPHCVLADEIHEFKNDRALKVWEEGITKMNGSPLMLMGTNTPATNQLVGTEYSELFQKVALEQAEIDSLFAFICRVDEADRDSVFDHPEVWQKSLPALGVTYPLENIRKRVQEAREQTSTAISLKRLYFGIPAGVEGFWIDEETWNKVQGEVDEADLVGAPCYLGLDLSKKNDLTALSACWVKDGRRYVKTYYFTTREGLADRTREDNAPYERWAAAGLLHAVPGATIDYTFVAARVADLAERHEIKLLAFDAAKIGDFIDACDQIGFEAWRFESEDKPAGQGLMLVSHGQGTRVLFKLGALCMPKSIVALEDGIKSQAITIEAHEVTSMCASNAVVIEDGMENRAFDKRRSRGRIDGMTSITQAVGASHSDLAETGGGLDDFLNNPVGVF